MAISKVILQAVEVLKKSFGGVDIEILDTDMIRKHNNPLYPSGYLGISIFIYSGFRKHRVFFTYSNAEDILFYGQHVADQFIYDIIKEDIPQLERKLKLDKINKL